MGKALITSAADRTRRVALHIRVLAESDDEAVVCAFHGIDMRLWRRAAFGRPVNADAHMAICAALGIDPVTATRPPPDIRLAGPLCWGTLGVGLRLMREGRGHSARLAAKAARISVATVSRCENGQALSFDSLARIAGYLRLHPHACTAPAMPGAPGSTGNTHCNSLISQEAGHAD